ncbi:MAG: LTA synthase family protein, partial [Clostridiales bacterium]|nr:LTA synthase family protein [Clostridiales bacterium]
YAQVSVCGGNTANSEFEFLTGNTMAFLPTGSIAYQQYIKNEIDSLPNWLEQLGYDTYAQHPYASSGWDRDRVYPLLGFMNLNFYDDYQNRTYVRNYVSDACDMKHIIQTYENRDTRKPFFLFNVTMQNHGGYTDAYDNLTNTVTAGLGSDVLDQYLTLLSLTDKALEDLISYFSQVDDDTMIIFFGDHQPNDSVVKKVWTSNGVDASSLTEGQERERYLVPYVIWANFDIDEATEKDTSLNFLAAQALELAGVPTSAYENFLLELNDYYSVISAAGETPAAGSDDEKRDELLDEYKIIQYYQLFDAGK